VPNQIERNDGNGMSAFLEYKLAPEFPFNIFEFKTLGNKDKLHWHNYHEIGLCLSGCGKFIFSNKEYPVCPGDLFVVANFESHVAVAEPDQSTNYLFIAFLPDLIASPGSRAFEFEYLAPFWYDIKDFCNKIDQSAPIAARIRQVMLEMKEVWAEEAAGCRHLIAADLKRILALLIHHYSLSALDPELMALKITNRIKLQPAFNYIHQNFMKNITLADVAELVHVSGSRFRHSFKEVTFIGFKEYVTYLRITEAKKLLLTTDDNVTDIAVTVGFNNLYQFYQQFEKHVSMTPAEYRKLYRDNIVGEVISKVGFEAEHL
jgi:AraC-type DNA-binding domain-containing proteins